MDNNHHAIRLCTEFLFEKERERMAHDIACSRVTLITSILKSALKKGRNFSILSFNLLDGRFLLISTLYNLRKVEKRSLTLKQFTKLAVTFYIHCE